MIYITGDTHGEMCRFDSGQIRKLKKGDTLIVCGDFGFIWDGGQKEEKSLKKLGKRKYNILFLDGTHENFDLLDQYPVTEWSGGQVQNISGNLYHLMRGQIFTIEGKKLFVFGGGETLEKQLRIAAGKWWEREMPSIEEMREGVKNLADADMAVDYIITHEPAPRVMSDTVNPKEKTNQLDSFFEQLVKQVKFSKWFFGSIHIDRKITAKNYAVFNDVLSVEPPQQRRFK
nr:metallophosphoesterase [uncultured Caproiciproducens sp.]